MMKLKLKLKAAIAVALLFVANVFAASIVVTEDVTENITWDADTVYIEKMEFTVESGARLTIMPGTTVWFRGGARYITVKGTITAIGTAQDSICFYRGDDKITRYGVRIIKRSSVTGLDTSKFSYCKFANFVSFYDRDLPYLNRGGALYVGSGNYVEFNNAVFSGNSSEVGGGAVYADTGSSVRVSSCYFVSNNATIRGGGAIMAVDGGQVDIFVENSRFDYNYSPYGGAVRIGQGTVAEFNNCIFYKDSTIQQVIGDGPFGGAMAIFGPADVTIRNSLFFHCRSRDKGGAIYSAGATLKLINNTIANNFAVHGGGVYLAHGSVSTSPQIINTIISRSKFPTGTELTGDVVYLEKGVTPSFRHSFMEDTVRVYDGDAATTYMGEFVNCINGNYAIRFAYNRESNLSDTLVEGYYMPVTMEMAIGPGINGGTPDIAGLGLPAYDILGNPRISNSAIDVGALEYPGLITMENTNTSWIWIPPSTSVGQGQRLGNKIIPHHPPGSFERIVYTLAGRKVAALGKHESVHTIKKRLPQGVYFIVTKDSGKKIQSKRLVVR